MTTQPKQVKVIGTRPTQAPTGWPIFNAPRPLYGDPTWTGDFIHGIFYATVDPTDPYGPGFIQRNAELDAWELVWVSEEEAIGESLDYYREKLPKLYANIDPYDKDHRGMLIDGWRERQLK